jgi:predicted nucleic acid-binding protein
MKSSINTAKYRIKKMVKVVADTNIYISALFWRNKHLLDVKEFRGIKIVTVRQILEILGV